MTDPRMTTTDAPVTVEQCDREAAAIAVTYERPPQYDGSALADQMRRGLHDDHPLVVIFARHRLAALASAPAGDGVEAKRWRERWYGSEPQKGSAIVTERGNLICYLGGDEQTHQLATAIVAAHNAALARPHSAVAPAGDGVSHGLGPHALTFHDDADGFAPVAILRGRCVYIQQGSAQITLSPDVADRLAAALARPRAAVGEQA